MYKNACDVVFGGLMYWMVGYGLQFGDWDHKGRAFCGLGRFAVDVNNDDEMGDVFVSYVFQVGYFLQHIFPSFNFPLSFLFSVIV